MRGFNRILLFLIMFFAGSGASLAQLRGVVVSSGDDAPLEGASVYWARTNIGVATNAEGEFNIGRTKGYDLLVASYLGYEPDTLKVSAGENRVSFSLRPAEIDEVVITASNRGNYIMEDGIMKDETISFFGLTKMACCNLAESFENSASVTVGYSDAITGARQIRMLGLAGIYTQLLDETRPIMRGLGSPYALSYTPGMWLESIQLSKGITSVTGGHEAIAGQINLEHRKPTDESPLFVNAYLDQDLRAELNIATAHKITDKLSHILLAHSSVNPLKLDHNGDGFMDGPIGTQFNMANRFLYVADNGLQLRAGLKYVNDKRQSGQTSFDPVKRRYPGSFDDSLPYGSEIWNENFNGYVKLAMPLGRYVYNEEDKNVERSNLAFILDYNHFNTDSYFGQLREYRGKQNSFYFNGMYSWSITGRHKLVSGISATSDSYDELLRVDMMTAGGGATDANGNNMRRTENEVGAYAEYTYSFRDRFTAVAGVRGDYSDMHGFFVTPRAHLRWSIVRGLSLRGSAGLGYRSANAVTDNLWIMATGRNILGPDGTQLGQAMMNSLNTLEESFTYGGSLTWTFRLGRDEAASLSADYFHTGFRNQLIADQEYDAINIWFYDSTGPSYTDTYQIDFNWSPLHGFDILATFRYSDTAVTLNRQDGGSKRVEKPLADRYKGLINLQYATRFRRWVFDFTIQVNGPMRLPSQDGGISAPEYSPAYPMLYFQVTRRFGLRTNVYAGCENITNFMQHHPVTWADGGSVYDHTFNSSRVWGPLMGRKFYMGVRINF